LRDGLVDLRLRFKEDTSSFVFGATAVLEHHFQ
jgi:hypothetical protein